MATPSRTCPAKTLLDVFGKDSRVPEDWDQGLSGEDAGLAQAILGLCLRHWGKLQAYVHPQLKDPSRGIPLGTQVALAIGLCQLAWLQGVSDHAAVHESVELAADRTLGFPPHKGLVNALLRRAASNRIQLRKELDDFPSQLDRTPFTQRVLQEALGSPHQDQALEDLWQQLTEPPNIYFQILNPTVPLPPGLTPVPEHTSAYTLQPGCPLPRTWLAQGHGMVQDLSSQALMAFQWTHPVRAMLDVCAAPGGKTTSLARRWPQAQLTALEQSPRRARRLQENLNQRGIQASVVPEEATQWMNRTQECFDLILLDAPCSGSGTLRKHPELNWLGHTLDLDRLAHLQRRLLEAALPRLAPGGLLIYSVCSWLQAEGGAHEAWLQEQAPQLIPAPIWQDAANGPTSRFRKQPLHWNGEGFQGFAWQKA